MKKIILIICIITTYQNLFAQDTLTYKGLVMTRIDNFFTLSLGTVKGGVGFNLIYENFWVPIDTITSKNYYQELKRGIYINYFNKIDSKFFDTINVNYNENRLNLEEINQFQKPFKTKKYWKKINKGDVNFCILEVEFQYIKLDLINLSEINICAKNRKQAYNEFTTMCYYITKITKMKPIKIE